MGPLPKNGSLTYSSFGIHEKAIVQLTLLVSHVPEFLSCYTIFWAVVIMKISISVHGAR